MGTNRVSPSSQGSPHEDPEPPGRLTNPTTKPHNPSSSPPHTRPPQPLLTRLTAALSPAPGHAGSCSPSSPRPAAPPARLGLQLPWGRACPPPFCVGVRARGALRGLWGPRGAWGARLVPAPYPGLWGGHWRCFGVKGTQEASSSPAVGPRSSFPCKSWWSACACGALCNKVTNSCASPQRLLLSNTLTCFSNGLLLAGIIITRRFRSYLQGSEPVCPSVHGLGGYEVSLESVGQIV